MPDFKALEHQPLDSPAVAIVRSGNFARGDDEGAQCFPQANELACDNLSRGRGDAEFQNEEKKPALKMRRVLLSVIVLSCTLGLAGAQVSTPVVDAKMVPATDAAYPNSSLKVAAIAQVAAGYHINDHKPTLDYLIPTELKLESTKEITVKNVVYPKGVPKKFAFADTPLSVYEGTVVVGALMQVAKGVAPGAYTLKGKLAYQACNDHACLPPASVPVSLEVKVVRRGVPLKSVNADVFQRIQLE